MKILTYVLFLSLSLLACTNTTETNNYSTTSTSVEISIEGMMCEKACGAKIKKELIEIEGVNGVDIEFVNSDVDNKAIVSFDPKRCSEKDLKTKIEKIAGGKLYQVKNITELKK